MYHATSKHSKTGMVMLTLVTIEHKTNSNYQRRAHHNNKRVNTLEIIIIDIFMPNNKASKYRKQKLIEIKRKLDNSTNKIKKFIS